MQSFFLRQNKSICENETSLIWSGYYELYQTCRDCGTFGGTFCISFCIRRYSKNEHREYRYDFNEKAFKNIPQNSQEVKRFVVPTNGIIALEIDGKVNLLSSNGRFVIQGTLYDTWAKKPLTTMSEITKNASIIPMKELNLNIADLRPAVWGDGPKKVMIFTAPGCEACAAPLSALADLDPKEFTVSVLSLGALGPASQQRNIELYCASDRYRADRAIISGNSTQKFDQVKNCDMQALARREVTAQILGVSMIPFIVRDDGSYVLGSPKQGLKNFIENK